MSRPTVAYVGGSLTHPLRLVVYPRTGSSVAKFLTITEALELSADLVSGALKAIRQEDNADKAAAAIRSACAQVVGADDPDRVA